MLKKIARECLPPVAYRLIRSSFRPAAVPPNGNGSIRPPGEPTVGRERPPQFYDESFEASKDYKAHYTKSRYYPLWTILADRITREGPAVSVLDIGCGPGQFAMLLRDKGIPSYLGIDFSPTRIQYARTNCPESTFVDTDVFETDLLQTHEYNVVCCMEFLEHVERDLDVIDRLRTGIHFYGTVPNFPYKAHVRHFRSPQEVSERYGPRFRSCRVDEHFANDKGTTFYIIDAFK